MADIGLWKRTGMFVPYYGKKWDSLADATAWEAIQEYKTDVLRHLSDGQGVMLYGPPGRGKTLLGLLICDEVLDASSTSLAAREALSVFTIQAYMNLFRQSMDALNITQKGHGSDDITNQYVRAERTIMRTLTTTKFVFIDDIGKEHTTATGYAEHQIERLIRARGNRGLPTILTSNAEGPTGLAKMYDQSLASYITQVCQMIPVMGRDFRVS